jgi:hypothetical protein
MHKSQSQTTRNMKKTMQHDTTKNQQSIVMDTKDMREKKAQRTKKPEYKNDQ